MLSSQIGVAGVPAKQQQAGQLTQKGHALLHQGHAAEALSTWEAATKAYRQLYSSEGVAGSLINQSLALQALGLYPRACNKLSQALNVENWICSSPIELQQKPKSELKLQLTQILQKQPNLTVTILGLHNLGDVLRLLGKPDESEIVLQKALAISKSLNPDTDANKVLLSLANTERTLYSRSKNKYQTTEEPIAKEIALSTSKSKASTAINLYRQVSDTTGKKQNSTALQAQLNYLSLLLELRQENTTVSSKIELLLKQLLTTDFSQLPTIQSIYAQLNLANSLMQISQNSELNKSLFPVGKKPLPIALTLAQEALEITQKLNEHRAKSYALGTIGKIYTQLGQASQSRKYFEKALGLAQSVQAWDIAYQWQQQLGHLHQLWGNRSQATEAYAAAIVSLEQVRGNILSVNPDIQFYFKEKVEPVYREYMKLLLAEDTPDLKQVIQTNEQLQLAQLENFLQCGKLELISLSEIQKLISIPTAIHLINLGEQVEVIVETPEHSFYRHTVDVKSVEKNTNALINIVQADRFNEIPVVEFLLYPQALYSQLIAPIKQYLPASGTLLFVLDSYFQNLPVAMLHDGENYLLQNYSIAIALGSQIRPPQALKQEQLIALIAGLSKPSPSFNSPNAPHNLEPLPEVKTEVADVRESISAATELMNEAFTSERFEQEIATDDFPLVHITTHGQFSSDPEQTVLLAWDKAINVRQLNSLLAGPERRSIELLVLSACQTAKGDKRSALGIAGVAAQAGARSTLATLWLVSAESTAQAMGNFYEGLSHGKSKAEALRQAQLSLLSHPKFQHPYYWSPFVLVGSWL